MSQAQIKPDILSTLDPNPARTRPEKPGPTYNSVSNNFLQFYFAIKILEFRDPASYKLQITRNLLP